MFPQLSRWILISFAALLVVTFTILSAPAQASAARLLDTNSNACLTCHEDLYYLHDTGKISCITEHADHCVNCHEGNAEVTDREASHLGMLIHPQDNNGQKCQACHPDDTEARLASYESTSGYQKVIKAEPYEPAMQVVSGMQSTPRENEFLQNLPWLIGSIVVFGLWLVLVFLSPQKP